MRVTLEPSFANSYAARRDFRMPPGATDIKFAPQQQVIPIVQTLSVKAVRRFVFPAYDAYDPQI
ncbi:MAG: hypothetical protein GDA56_10895 [Hormoscilla sp. GM7CHS1pb]|nr:hypothetical protein [Hormoscilla sp. GM7CHS1pb]